MGTLYPVLVITPLIGKVEKQLEDHGVYVNDVQGIAPLRELLREIRCMSEEHTVAIKDLAFFSPQMQATLLKILEEGCVRLVVIASCDNISEVLLSRFPTVKKTPYVVEVCFDQSLPLVDESEDKLPSLEQLLRSRCSKIREYHRVSNSPVAIKARILRHLLGE